MTDYVEIDDVNVLVERELSLLCLIENEEIWIPKSLISSDSEVHAEGDHGTLIVEEWKAKQEGLI